MSLPSRRPTWPQALLLAAALALGSNADAASKARPAAPAKKATAKAGKPGKAAKGAARKARGPQVVDIGRATPPAAVLPPVLREALLRHGCADGGQLESAIGAAWADVAPRLGEAGGGCRPFASVTVPGRQAAAFALMPASATAQPLLVSLRESDTGARTREAAIAGAGLQELTLAFADIGSDGPLRAEGVPAAVQRELVLLARHMRRQTNADDRATVRALLEGEGDDLRLVALELTDPLTGRPYDSAVWVQRDDAPGAFISTQGIDYERMLWQAPVDFQRITRGLQFGSVIIHRRVVAKVKGRKKPKLVVRAFRHRGQHIGIDFAAPQGTPVVAVADGEVIFAGWKGGYGNLVIVQHGPDHTTHYAHLSAFAPGLAEGMRVRRSEQIGQVGSTGFSTGPHLHFEVRKDGQYVDPMNQSLPIWGLGDGDHETAAMQMLRLELGRPQPLLQQAEAALPGAAAQPLLLPRR